MSTTFSFLVLPREIRDRIYDFVLEGHYDFFDGPFGLSITYGSPCNTEKRQKLACGISASKQVLSEALSQLHRYGKLNGPLYMLPSPQRAGLVNVRKFPKIQINDYSEALIFRLLRMAPPGPSTVVLQVEEFGRKDRLIVLAEYLKLGHNCLKDLTIKFAIRCMATAGMVQVDMSFLEGIAQLNRAEFVLEEPELDKDQDELSHFAFVYGLVQQELIRVAQSLVTNTVHEGREGGLEQRGCITKDWLDEERFEELTGDNSNYWFVDHSWHIECRLGLRGAEPHRLNHEGLSCWLAVAYDVGGEMCHFKRVPCSEHGSISWLCELSNERITVPCLS